MNVSDWRRSRLLLVSGAAVVTVAVGLLATLYVVRDGDGDAVTTSGDPAPLATGELNEVLEPEDVLVESFGDGWGETGRVVRRVVGGLGNEDVPSIRRAAVDCRNSGSVPAGGDEWELVDPVPLDWRDRGPQQGDLTIVDDQNAVFVSHDGVELRVTVGAHPEECIGWDDDE